MNRLQTELRRLYLPYDATAGEPKLLGKDGDVRALVLALVGPADWEVLAPLWRGVQADLEWPAPAIAVNGRDGFELWFSLAEPLPCAEATRLLAYLQRRYLGDVRTERVRVWPGADMAASAPSCPPFAATPERWAAFVAPDLPAVFGDDPALDFEPGADAQAELLARLRTISSAELRRAQTALSAQKPLMPACPAPTIAVHEANGAVTSATSSFQDPRAFLLAVMNDAAVPLALRIDAAKGLLCVQANGDHSHP
jgi:hypothetical protein